MRGKGGSRKLSEEATAIVQVGDDGWTRVGAMEVDKRGWMLDYPFESRANGISTWS